MVSNVDEDTAGTAYVLEPANCIIDIPGRVLVQFLVVSENNHRHIDRAEHRELVRSVIGRPENQVKTVQALGLRKIGQTREVNDTPAMRGMVNTVKHLLEVQE